MYKQGNPCINQYIPQQHLCHFRFYRSHFQHILQFPQTSPFTYNFLCSITKTLERYQHCCYNAQDSNGALSETQVCHQMQLMITSSLKLFLLKIKYVPSLYIWVSIYIQSATIYNHKQEREECIPIIDLIMMVNQIGA